MSHIFQAMNYLASWCESIPITHSCFQIKTFHRTRDEADRKLRKNTSLSKVKIVFLLSSLWAPQYLRSTGTTKIYWYLAQNLVLQIVPSTTDSTQYYR